MLAVVLVRQSRGGEPLMMMSTLKEGRGCSCWFMCHYLRTCSAGPWPCCIPQTTLWRGRHTSAVELPVALANEVRFTLRAG